MHHRILEFTVAADEAVVTTVVRTRSQCETFLHAVIEGRLGKLSKFDGEKAVATPQIDSVRDLCRKLLNQNSAKNQVGDGMNLGARNGTSSSRETLDPDIAAAMAAAATIDASTGGARSRYLRPSRKKKSERDLSAEFAFCAYLENILQILLEISTTRNSVLLADFLGITSTAVEDDSREITVGGYRAENCFGLIQKKVKNDEENLNKKMKQCVSEGDGHNPRNIQPFKNLFTDTNGNEDTDGHYYTNMELYDGLHPNNRHLEYVYDNFEWKHCNMIGYQMKNS